MKRLSVIIPTYNEAKTLPVVVKEVTAAEAFGLEKEIIIINDGSSDDTNSVLKNLQKQYNKKLKKLVVISHQKNKGKGAAVKAGIIASTGDIVLIQDADLEYTPRDYPKLLGPLIQNQADVVYGSRFQTTEARRVLFFGIRFSINV